MPKASPIVLPRWEWRMIEPSLGELREALAGVAIETVREIQETYLLCGRSSHNCKIRSGLLDLKWRTQVDARGLELWNPILKSGFPIEAAPVQEIFGAWSLPRPALERPAFSLEQFLQEVIAPHPELRAVAVEKRREGFTLDGTTCEFAALSAQGITLESFCVEHEDPLLVLTVLSRLGLDSRRNTNYPKALKRALAQQAA